MANTSTPPLLEALNLGWYLHPGARNAMSVCVCLPPKMEKRNYRYGKKAFDALHPDLHAWLCRDWEELRSGSLADALLLQRARCYLHWAAHPDAAALPWPQEGWWVSRIHDAAYTANNTVVQIKATQYQRGTDATGAWCVTQVKEDSTLLYSAEKLDAIWPGASERLRIAQTLDLTMPERVTYVFSPAPAPMSQCLPTDLSP